MANDSSHVEAILNYLDDERDGVVSPEAVEFPNNIQAMLEERPTIKSDSFINMIIRGAIFR
jgi:hypothetical protein